KDDAAKRTFIAEIIHMRLRKIFTESPTRRHMELSRRLADSPASMPVLFSEHIPPGRKLQPTDFLAKSVPLDRKRDDHISNSPGGLHDVGLVCLMPLDRETHEAWKIAQFSWSLWPPDK